MELIVFTNNGQTFKFCNVKNLMPNTTGFTFEYLGKATGVWRKATFNNTSVAGYATAEEKEKVVYTNGEGKIIGESEF